MVRVKTYLELVNELSRTKQGLEETRKENEGSQRMIPEVEHEVLSLLSERAIELEKALAARRRMMTATALGEVFQEAMPFLYECEIEEDEIPF